LIEFINFILSNQDDTAPIAILACMVDYSKAFNRIDHNLLVTKLSDMGVPGWLLSIVMAFLNDRSMIVRYNGTKQVRSLLELAVPAWNGALKQNDNQAIERVQKTALHIMLGESYVSYRNALGVVGLQSLEERRHKLCLKFATKAVKHDKHSKWFVPNVRVENTRLEQDKFCPVYAKHKRFEDSPISYLTKLLNSDSLK
jgi:hypothetical protein